MDFFKKIPLWEYAAVILILLFYLSIQLYYAFSIPHPPLVYDAHNYDVMARQFLEKGFLGYASTRPNAFTTPGYPLFLAMLYKIFGYSQGSPLMEVRLL